MAHDNPGPAPVQIPIVNVQVDWVRKQATTNIHPAWLEWLQKVDKYFKTLENGVWP